MTAKPDSESARRKAKPDKRLKIKKETVKDLDPDTRGKSIRGGAAGTNRAAGDGRDIC